MSEHQGSESCAMPGTYRGRSRHRLPRREGARSAGRTGGAPQYVPADMYPPATVFLRKRSRCLFPPSTCHGIPAKVFQVSLPAVHLPRNPCESVPGDIFLSPTWHGISAKAFQVSLSASHLARNPRKSVPGVSFRLPPGTEFPRKRSRCLFPPSTCHGIPAKVFQVSFPASHLPRNPRKSVPGVLLCFPPATESPQKRSRCPIPPPPDTVSLRKRSRCPFPPPTWHGNPAKTCQVSFPAAHLARYSRESVPGVSSRCPPATVSPRKRVRCLSPLPTWHGIPAKAFQVSLPASHLARNSCESVPGVTSCLPPGTEIPRKRSRCHFLPSTCHGIPAKAFQVSPSASHLLRFPRKSVSGVTFCRPPGTVFPQKRSRCPSLLPTCHGIPAKAFHVAPLAFHLLRQFLSSWDVGTFQQGKLVVFSKKRATIGTPEVGECVHLSENHDVSKKVQLRVCRVMLHLEITTSCDCLIIRDFAICAICRCATESRIDVQKNRCSAISECNIMQ